MDVKLVHYLMSDHPIYSVAASSPITNRLPPDCGNVVRHHGARRLQDGYYARVLAMAEFCDTVAAERSIHVFPLPPQRFPGDRPCTVQFCDVPKHGTAALDEPRFEDMHVLFL